MATPPNPTHPASCAACGQPVTGRFCGQCGAKAESAPCPSCQAPLAPGARFCHRCGRAAGPSRTVAATDRRAWIVAGAMLVVAVGAVAFALGRTGVPQPVIPAMGNVGNAAPAGAAPDISQLSPMERFIRLHDRIMTAAEAGDTATVFNFTPMALGAYAQLDTVTIDARYHAATLHAQIGQYPEALALADTILAQSPNNLFGFVVQGTVAELRRDTAALTRARQAFLKAFPQEIDRPRQEYLDHRTLLDQFRATAAGTR